MKYRVLISLLALCPALTQAATYTATLSIGQLHHVGGSAIADGGGTWAVIVGAVPGLTPTSGALPGGLTSGNSLTQSNLSQAFSDLSGATLAAGEYSNFTIHSVGGFTLGSVLGVDGVVQPALVFDVVDTSLKGYSVGTLWGFYWFPGLATGATLPSSFEVGGFANSAANAASGGEAGTTIVAAGATNEVKFYETNFNQDVVGGADTGLSVSRFTSVARLSWDANGGTAGAQGGTGAWNASATNWNTGSSNYAWATTGADNDANFGGTAGTVTISTAVTANDLAFTTTGYTIASGTLTLNGTTPTVTTATSVSATISSQILGTAGLTKAGAGTLILSGANSYTGATSIQSGVLVIDGSTAAGSAVVVSSGAKLAGTGTVGGGTTVESGGKYSAGAVGAAGQQTFSGNLNFQSGSIFEWDLTSASTTEGFDKVIVNNGTLTGGGEFRVVTGLDFSPAAPFWAQSRTWNVFTGTGTLTGWAQTLATVYNSSGVARNDVAAYGSFTISGASLTWTAVPETSNVLIGSLIGLGLLRRRRG